MLDLTSDKGRFISAAMGLAAEKPWAQVTLADIAERAGSSLVALKPHFASKGEILAAFIGAVDDEMLRRAPRRGDAQPPRDALFEVVMSRFDILDPWKGALKSITASGLPEFAHMRQALATPGWMLEAAGVNSGGLEGGARSLGLAAIYASVLQVWLEDDDPGLARTMAALDRRLRRGQRTLERANELCAGVSRIGAMLQGALRGARASARPQQPTEPGPAAPGTPSGAA